MVDTARGQRKAKAPGQGRSVFRAPLSFRGPLGCVVLPLALRLREETRLGDQKNYKSLQPPRRGRAWCWTFLVLVGWKWERTKGMGERLCRLCGSSLHVAHVLHLIFITSLRGTVVSILEDAQLLARDHRVPRCRDKIEPKALRISITKPPRAASKGNEIGLSKREKEPGPAGQRFLLSKENVVAWQLQNDMK